MQYKKSKCTTESYQELSHVGQNLLFLNPAKFYIIVTSANMLWSNMKMPIQDIVCLLSLQQEAWEMFNF